MTTGGAAYGTSSANGPSGTDDSYAFLSSTVFSASSSDQYAHATIRRNSPSGSYSEVELHLRAGIDSATNHPRLYEVYLSLYGQYFTVVRWNASGHTFMYLAQFGAFTPPADGDELDAQIVGNIITVKLRGSPVGTLDVSNPPLHETVDGNGATISNTWDGIVYATGAPGIGFDTDGNDNGAGFSHFEAGTLP